MSTTKTKASSSSAESSKKSKSKTRKAPKSAAFIDTHNEDANTAEEEEALLLARYESLTETLEETDWEALQKDSNVELWAIRIPRDLKVRHLNDLTLNLPSSKALSTFEKKGVTYSVSNADSIYSDTSEEGVPTSSAAEMQSLSCLVSSSARNGQLYSAPKPFTRRIVISHNATTPTPAAPSTEEAEFPHGHSKRPFQPLHLLTSTFSPIGALNSNELPGYSREQDADVEMEVDVDELADDSTSPSKLSSKSSKGDKSKRKHADEGEENASKSPKVKKHKRPKVDAV